MRLRKRPKPCRNGFKKLWSVVAGTYLNAKCNWLNQDQELVAMQNIKTLTEALSIEFKSQHMVILNHNAAINHVQTEKYASCGDDAKNLAQAGTQYGQIWADQVRRVYQSRKSTTQTSPAPAD